MATPTAGHETKKVHKKHRKPYEEIGAIFNGNEVLMTAPGKMPQGLAGKEELALALVLVGIKIRVPKSTSKPAKLTPSQLKLQQQCTCEDDESVCSETCGYPPEYGGGPANKLNFQIPDDICEGLTNRTALNSELTYSKKEAHDPLCALCNVTPADAPKGVKAHKVLHPDKDVFILKIGKQTDEPNRTGNIEVELVTPRAPAKFKPPTHACKNIQCEEGEIGCCAPCRACRPPPPRRRKPRRARCCRPV